jgi:hypothetical protein
MNRQKLIFSFASFVTVGIFVAVGMGAFEGAPQESSLRSLLGNLLFPGYMVGFVLGQRAKIGFWDICPAGL